MAAQKMARRREKRTAVMSHSAGSKKMNLLCGFARANFVSPLRAAVQESSVYTNRQENSPTNRPTACTKGCEK